ncbi:MAG: ATP-binding protein [Planctomycetota bacterium]
MTTLLRVARHTTFFRFVHSRVLIHLSNDAEKVCIDVEDDGPGIPESKRVEILAPFVRLDERRIDLATVPEEGGDELKENDSGLGLGLAIVDLILTQHGGSIKIDQGELGGCLVCTVWPR